MQVRILLLLLSTQYALAAWPPRDDRPLAFVCSELLFWMAVETSASVSILEQRGQELEKAGNRLDEKEIANLRLKVAAARGEIERSSVSGKIDLFMSAVDRGVPPEIASLPIGEDHPKYGWNFGVGELGLIE